MRSQVQDTLDKFHEEICKWDLHKDIIALDEEIKPQEIKNTFYSPEQYSYYQKQCLLGELKSMSQKNGHRIVPFEVDEGRTGYEMIHCTNVNKFFVFEFKLVERKDTKVPLMNQGDFVVLFRSNATFLEDNHLMGVIDFVNVDGKVLILKTFIDVDATDRKTHNVCQQIINNSEWNVFKVSSLVNFNKAYLAAQSITDIQIQESLLEPLNYRHQNQSSEWNYTVPKSISDQLSLDQYELNVMHGVLRKKGISIVDGVYLSGKTTLAVALLKALFLTSSHIKQQEELKLKNKKVKTYSIKELMENDSSDDEGYRPKEKNNKLSTSQQFPWFHKSYKHIADQLDFTQQEKVSAFMGEQYPTSETTDHKIIMKEKEKNEVPLPEKILFVSPNSFTVDQLLIKSAKMLGPNFKLLRLGHSLTNQDLNKKYSIDHLSGSVGLKERNDQVDLVRKHLVEDCHVLFISLQQLSSQVFERSTCKFDTVIIDDASLVSESDVLQTLKHGALRLYLFGNSKIEQNQFQLHPRPDRTLFRRILRSLATEPTFIETILSSYSERHLPVTTEVAPAGKALNKRSASKNKEEVKVVTQPSPVELEIHFIDLSTSEEKQQKDSFINEEEAQQVIDYINMFNEQLYAQGQTCAIMTPYRPQSLLLKNTLAEREDLELDVKQRLTNSEIGAFDDFMSRTFDNVVVSLCKTKNIEKFGGPLLNNPLNVEFLKSRTLKKLVVISKSRGLPQIWKQEIIVKAKEQGHYMEI